MVILASFPAKITIFGLGLLPRGNFPPNYNDFPPNNKDYQVGFIKSHRHFVTSMSQCYAYFIPVESSPIRSNKHIYDTEIQKIWISTIYTRLVRTSSWSESTQFLDDKSYALPTPEIRKRFGLGLLPRVLEIHDWMNLGTRKYVIFSTNRCVTLNHTYIMWNLVHDN